MFKVLKGNFTFCHHSIERNLRNPKPNKCGTLENVIDKIKSDVEHLFNKYIPSFFNITPNEKKKQYSRWKTVMLKYAGTAALLMNS